MYKTIYYNIHIIVILLNIGACKWKLNFREIPVHTGMIQALPLVFSGGSIRVQERDFLLNLKLGLIACQFNVSLSWLRNPQNKIMITKI